MNKFNLNDKKFITLENKQGLSSNETIFHYNQEGEIITGSYKGGAILEGRLVGKQTGANTIELLFQCVTDKNELKSGMSEGVVSKNKQGKLQLKFDWAWLNGDYSGGTSEYIEIENYEN